MRRWTSLAIAAIVWTGGCGGSASGATDGGTHDAGSVTRDGGGVRDGGGPARDAGNTVRDAGSTDVDAGSPMACTPAPADHMGDGTYYSADGSGNCSFPASPGDLMVGAMNHVDYMGSAPCGACADVTGPSGEVTVRIVDQCPECAAGAIDLSPQAFQRIAALSLGRVPITWHYVACDVTGPVVYHFKQGSNQWWTAVQIRNHRYAIARFEYLADDGTFHDVPRLNYNYFVEASGMGPGPYTFRITDVWGHVLEDAGVPFIEAGDSPGAAQFPSCE